MWLEVFLISYEFKRTPYTFTDSWLYFVIYLMVLHKQPRLYTVKMEGLYTNDGLEKIWKKTVVA